MADRELLKVDEAAKILGIGRTTAYDMIARHELPFLRVSRKLIKVPRKALAEWITDRTERAA